MRTGFATLLRRVAVMADESVRVTTVRGSRWLLLLATAFAACALRAAEPPLARMVEAIRTLDYQGSFVYARGTQVDALRIFHAAGGVERERLVGLNGPRSEIVRAGATVACTQGSAPTMLFRDPSARLLPLLPDLRDATIGRYYAVTQGVDDRIAGYRAHRVDVVPRDAYRYGYRFWLEDDSGFPLRSAVVDASGRSLEEFMFVTLDLGAKPRESDLAAGPGSTVVAPVDEPAAGTAHWRVADPPPGFVLSRTHAPAAGTEHQVYTDGVAHVSIYIEPGAAPARGDQRLSRGMLAIYAHEIGNLRVVAIGDVPRVTLERMARSLQPIASAP